MFCHHSSMRFHPHLVTYHELQEDVNILLTSILSQREQDILKMHYGVGQDDGQQLSFDKIGLRQELQAAPYLIVSIVFLGSWET